MKKQQLSEFDLLLVYKGKFIFEISGDTIHTCLKLSFHQNVLYQGVYTRNYLR